MLGRLQKDLQRRSDTFGQVMIERRVLLTPKSTISIPNIAVISTGTVGTPRRLVGGVALVLLAAGLAALLAGFSLKANLVVALGGIAMLIGLVALPFARGETACLSITSNNGDTARFIGQRKTLEEVRRLLSDKINAGDDDAVYRVNFEKGIIQPIGGQAESIGALLAGSGGAPPPVGYNARHGGPALDAFASTSAPPPGLQLGNVAFPAAGASIHVDYAQILPQIVDMQRFYAQRADTQDIAERLNEMEYLMRSGTPTPGSRSRINQLAGELGSILGAYPGVVQIFHQAARLAGY
jgi:hypothetical protein